MNVPDATRKNQSRAHAPLHTDNTLLGGASRVLTCYIYLQDIAGCFIAYFSESILYIFSSSEVFCFSLLVGTVWYRAGTENS